MAAQHLEAIDSTVQKTHEWLGAIAEASHLSKALGPPLKLRSPNTRTSSSRASVYFGVARHLLAKLAVAAIPLVIIVALGVAAIAAFVGGYLAASG